MSRAIATRPQAETAGIPLGHASSQMVPSPLYFDLLGPPHKVSVVCVQPPVARPATITAAMLSFVYHWQEFLDPLIYLSDFMTYPISLGLRMYQSMAGTWANLLMATSLIALVPVAIVFLLCERYIMRGLGVMGRID